LDGRSTHGSGGTIRSEGLMKDKEITAVEFYERFPEEVPTYEDVEEVTGFISFFPWSEEEANDIYSTWRTFDR
jgi:hypothetical protein